MPNLYGKQPDEEKDQQDQAGETPAFQQPGESQGNAQAIAPPQSAPGFTNLEDVFNLNKKASQDMANAQTRQIGQAAGNLQGRGMAPQVDPGTMGAAAANRDKTKNNLKAQPMGRPAKQITLTQIQDQVENTAKPGGPAAQAASPFAGMIPDDNSAKVVPINTLDAYKDMTAQQIEEMQQQDDRARADAAMQGMSDGSELGMDTVVQDDGKAPTYGDQGVSRQGLGGTETRNTAAQEQAATPPAQQTQPTTPGAQDVSALVSTETRGVRNADGSWSSPLGAYGQELDTYNRAKDIQDKAAANAADTQKKLADLIAADQQKTTQDAKDYGSYKQLDELLESRLNDQGQELLGNVYGEGNVNAYDAALAGLGGANDTFDALNKQFKDYDQEFLKSTDKAAAARKQGLDVAKGRAGMMAADKQLADDQMKRIGDRPDGMSAANGGHVDPDGDLQGVMDKARTEFGLKGTGATMASELKDQLVEKASAMSIENWDQWGKNYQGDLAQQIGKEFGMDNAQAQQALADFYRYLSTQGDGSLAIWAMFLTSEAGSTVGQGVLNIFGLGDAVHSATTSTNSSPEEWSMFQDMFRAFLRKTTSANGGQRVQ